MAVAEMVAPSKPEVNYRPAGSLRFGGRTRAQSPMPRWVVELSGISADKLVRDGKLEETLDPVTDDFRAPVSVDPETAPAMAEELTNLRKENTRVRAENKGLAANNETLRAKEAAQTVALGELQATVAHWRQQAEAHRAALVEAEKTIATLRDELNLERSTKPDQPTPAPVAKPVTKTK